MTEAQQNEKINASIAARIAAEPSLAPCVCVAPDNNEWEPDRDVEQHTGFAFIGCPDCERSIVAPTRSESVRMWNAAMGAKV